MEMSAKPGTKSDIVAYEPQDRCVNDISKCSSNSHCHSIKNGVVSFELRLATASGKEKANKS